MKAGPPEAASDEDTLEEEEDDGDLDLAGYVSESNSDSEEDREGEEVDSDFGDGHGGRIFSAAQDPSSIRRRRRPRSPPLRPRSCPAPPLPQDLLSSSCPY
jgi:hypothetical protein